MKEFGRIPTGVRVPLENNRRHLPAGFAFIMKTENKKKSQKKIQIKGKMPLSVHFFRDAEADALNMERCQLDKATLIACAVKRLREDLGNVPDSGKKPSA